MDILEQKSPFVMDVSQWREHQSAVACEDQDQMSTSLHEFVKQDDPILLSENKNNNHAPWAFFFTLIMSDD